MKRTILLVDDEPKVISALIRELNSFQFNDILSAYNGTDALDLLRHNNEIAVIISDYRMPGMDGITFLLQAQEICPDATRMILTGVADLEMATNAINLGQIYRLLLKPCPTESFINSVNAAIRQYELVTSERDLLQNTLKGSIKILTDLLSAISPDSFSQANRISALTRRFARELKLENAWEMELAGVLCRIGCVTVPPEVLDAWMKGKKLDLGQLQMMDSVPKIGNHLLKNIPRLEKIAAGILYQSTPYQPVTPGSKTPAGQEIPLIGRILKIVIDYDRYFTIEQNLKIVLGKMTYQISEYDPKLFVIFRDQVISAQEGEKTSSSSYASPLVEIPYDQVKSGMVIMANVFDNKGRMLISAGTVVTEILKIRLANYCRLFGLDQPLVVRRSDIQE